MLLSVPYLVEVRTNWDENFARAKCKRIHCCKGSFICLDVFDFLKLLMETFYINKFSSFLLAIKTLAVVAILRKF